MLTLFISNCTIAADNGNDPSRDASSDQVISDIIPPEVPMDIVRSRLKYPMIANKLGIEGIVTVELHIIKDGTIKNITIIQEPGHGLGDAVVEAFENIRCKPATADGEPVDHKFEVSIKFKLKTKRKTK